MTVEPQGQPYAPAPPVDASADAIIDAALEEVAMFGPRRARMTDIARRAGVSSATLYRRFDTKQKLIDAVIIREMGRFVVAMREVVAREDVAADSVVEAFVFATEYLRDRTVLARIIETEPDAVLPALTTGAEQLIAQTADFMLDVNAENLFVEVADWDAVLARERIELVVRIFISLQLAPSRVIDLSTTEACRQFARRSIAPLLVQAEDPHTRRPKTG